MNNIETAIKDLEILRSLKDDWNSYGAKAPIDEVINTAITFVKLLAGYTEHPIDIGPMQDGSIGVSWTEKMVEVDVDFYVDHVECLVCLIGDNKIYQEHNWHGNFNIEHILPTIESIKERI